jgi:hypothetical protein
MPAETLKLTRAQRSVMQQALREQGEGVLAAALCKPGRVHRQRASTAKPIVSCDAAKLVDITARLVSNGVTPSCIFRRSLGFLSPGRIQAKPCTNLTQHFHCLPQVLIFERILWRSWV